MNPLLLTLAPGVELRLVHVPAGEFLMGSTDGDKYAWNPQKPQHVVYLDEFHIGLAPVTVAQFGAFVRGTDYRTTAEGKHDGWTWQHPRGPQSGVRSKGKHPVTCVSWDDATAFCAWASRASGRLVRLPTEAEWEKAARGTDGRIYPWGNETDLTRRCNCRRKAGDTTPVGRYSPQGNSPYGCVDMAGNVWEWVADWYDADYYRQSPRENPPGPASGQYRVLRGGCWSTSSVRAAFRLLHNPCLRNDDVGFRVVASPILL
jgi:formylglycine-generating enzyme required for sulfatase activity